MGLFRSFWHISVDRQEEHRNVHLESSISRDREEELLKLLASSYVPSVFPQMTQIEIIGTS